ncbi:hypothetical protein [Flagellimonas sp. 2504JD4-2]
MIKKYLLYFFLFAYINSGYSQDYFEGEIQYKIEYEALNQNISTEYLEKEIGKSFTAHVKEDRYSMIYNADGTNGWMKIIVRLDKGYYYTEFEKQDTITKTKFAPEKRELFLFERNHAEKKEVLDELCESVTIVHHPGEEIPFAQEIRGTHYFSPKYRLNKEKYKDYGNGFWNRYVNESGAISIRNETEYVPFFKSISEAVSIEEKQIPDSLFEPNRDKPLKED